MSVTDLNTKLKFDEFALSHTGYGAQWPQSLIGEKQRKFSHLLFITVYC